jgi:hypothetical protein
MPSPAVGMLLRACMHVSVGNSIGTGFFVRVRVGPSENGRSLHRTFLVTNKHVIAQTIAERATIRNVLLGCDIRHGEDIRAETIDLTYTDDAYVEHPDPDVDVCSIDVGYVHEIPGIVWDSIPLDTLVFGDRLRALEISAGEEVLLFGYPLGFRQGGNNRPLVRQGMLATDPAMDLVDYSRTPHRLRHGFLVDGGVIPGASGGPVVLKPQAARHSSGGVVVGGDQTPYVVGIIAETRFSTIVRSDGVATPSYAGLGFAFSSRTIVETIGLFESCLLDARAAGAWPL